nr:MAG TPA: hypothetical protein [Caudoviricetes sp.]DAW45826.1 MAG TPA: hypothetical protein [Caudoviricetes sp.]
MQEQAWERELELLGRRLFVSNLFMLFCSIFRN